MRPEQAGGLQEHAPDYSKQALAARELTVDAAEVWPDTFAPAWKSVLGAEAGWSAAEATAVAEVVAAAVADRSCLSLQRKVCWLGKAQRELAEGVAESSSSDFAKRFELEPKCWVAGLIASKATRLVTSCSKAPDPFRRGSRSRQE